MNEKLSDSGGTFRGNIFEYIDYIDHRSGRIKEPKDFKGQAGFDDAKIDRDQKTSDRLDKKFDQESKRIEDSAFEYFLSRAINKGQILSNVHAAKPEERYQTRFVSTSKYDDRVNKVDSGAVLIKLDKTGQAHRFHVAFDATTLGSIDEEHWNNASGQTFEEAYQERLQKMQEKITRGTNDRSEGIKRPFGITKIDYCYDRLKDRYSAPKVVPKYVIALDTEIIDGILELSSTKKGGRPEVSGLIFKDQNHFKILYEMRRKNELFQLKLENDVTKRIYEKFGYKKASELMSDDPDAAIEAEMTKIEKRSINVLTELSATYDLELHRYKQTDSVNGKKITYNEIAKKLAAADRSFGMCLNAIQGLYDKSNDEINDYIDGLKENADSYDRSKPTSEAVSEQISTQEKFDNALGRSANITTEATEDKLVRPDFNNEQDEESA